jgi:hypothetical protein
VKAVGRAVCRICHRRIEEDDEVYVCGECGKVYCGGCAEEDPTIKSLGVCPDCEEVYEAEEDYWGWGDESDEW